MIRISLNDSFLDACVKMADGNPGAATVLVQLAQKVSIIDPENILGPWGPILFLDMLELYGPAIWIVYKDICGENIARMLALLRAVQFGFCSMDALKDAATGNYNERVPLDLEMLIKKVQERLPAFKIDQ